VLLLQRQWRWQAIHTVRLLYNRSGRISEQDSARGHNIGPVETTIIRQYFENERKGTYVVVIAICDQAMFRIDQNPAEWANRRTGIGSQDSLSNGSAGKAT
jgi:hypothetical protein